MLHRNGWILAVAVFCAACGAGALKVDGPGSESADGLDKTEALLRRSSTYDVHFREASEEFHVPAALLKAVAYAQTRYSPAYGEAEFDGQPVRFGVMGLSPEDVTKAAALAGVDEDVIKNHALANIRAAAALLQAHADALDLKNRLQVTAWAPAVAKFSGIRHTDLARAFVRDSVYQALTQGLGAPTDELATTGQSLTLDGEFAKAEQGLSASPDYPAGVWRTAPNFTGSRGGYSPSVVIIHTCEGGYYGCQDWLASPSTQASAHYLVKEDGSEVVQMVRDANRAWHIGATYNCGLNGGQLCDRDGVSANNFTIGIEHAGHAAQSSWSDGLVDASTKLSCHLSRKYGIPVDRYHYVGHGQLQPYNRTDPGANWPWSKYMAMVSSNCGGAGGAPAVASLAAEFVSQGASTLRPIAGRAFSFQFTVKNTGSNSWVDWNRVEDGRSVRLGFVGGESFGIPGRISLNSASDTDVHGNESVTFTLNGTAPAVPGKYRSEWQLVSEGIAWYGPKMWMDFDVQPVPGLEAAFVGQSASTLEVVAGQKFDIAFSVKNTGLKPWVDNNIAQEGQAVRLGFVGGRDFGISHRVSVKAASDADAQPGDTTTWTLQGQAPLVPGVYRTQWQPVSEWVAWFGPSMWIDVVVRPKEALLVGLRTNPGLFVAVEQNPKFNVNANRQSQGPWETFALIDHNGGSLQNGDVVSFQSVSGLFLAAESGGGGAVVGNRREMGPWEKFTVEKLGGAGAEIQPSDPVAFRTFDGQHYLCAESGGGGALTATRTVPLAWETFKLQFDPAVRGALSLPSNNEVMVYPSPDTDSSVSEAPTGGSPSSANGGASAASISASASGCSVVDLSPTGLFAPLFGWWLVLRRRRPYRPERQSI